MAMTDSEKVLKAIESDLYVLERQNEKFYKTVDLLKKAAKQNATPPMSKPLPGILDAIGEANWVQYNRVRSKLMDLRTAIREVQND